ncbi:MAG TPA: LamG-like jellyroll fold domain-containing protein [Opitutaceae bacterium]|nr:LamG-like jellyroll fold domain-containing protein [Opitutaceae bacterium]
MKTRLVWRGALLALLSVTAHASVQASYYVDPVNGSDSNNGTSPGTAFATLTRARNAVETVNSNMTGDIVVNLLPGDYLVSTPIALTQADSGTNGHNVIWTCDGPRGSARIIGGVKATGWTLDTGNVYKTTISLGSQRVEAIFENGVRGVLAREPNTGYYVVNAADSTYPKKKFQWKSGDTIPAVATPTDLQVLMWPGSHDWSTEIHDVASIDRSNRWITMTTNIQQAYLGTCAAGSRYFIQGARELLDQPGEFYYDASTSTLYYYPRNTPIANQEIIVPVTTSIFSGTTSNPQQLNGLWQFENNTADSSLAGNDGTANNSPTFVASATGLGQAISLDGSTQYVTVADDPSIAFGATSNGFTLAAWIQTSGTGTQPIICKARPDAGTFNMDYKFWLNASGHLELTRWNKPNSTNSTVTDTGPALNDGAWHHVAFVNESDTSHKLYVDGVLSTTSTSAWTYDDSNAEDMEIGRFADNTNGIYYYFAGQIDDARLYQSALSASDISDLYTQAAPPPSALQNISFINLKFVATNLDYTNPSGLHEGMIVFENASNLLVENNEFDNVGASAVNIVGPGSGIQVLGNYIDDAGIAGVALGDVSDSTVSNNHIHNTAQVFADAGACVHLDSVTGCEISYNNLSVSKRHGVRMHTATGNTIEYNEIYHTTTDSQDAGSVYWGYSDGNTVNHNRIHDSGSFGQQQHGLYVEDGSDHTTITNNIVYNIGPSPSDNSCESINVKGVGNLVQNNIFDFTKSHAALRTYEIKANAAANNETVQYNIMYSTGSSGTLYYFQSYADNRIKVSDYNLFYKTASGAFEMYNIPGSDTLANWKTLQSNKYDQHSVTADPGFVDAANHDYDFTGSAPTGFTPIDASVIGTQPSFIYPSTSGQWVFSGNATDITLNGHNGTVTAATYTADRFGTASSALSFNGSSAYVNVPNDATLAFGNPANPFTVVAWVKSTSASGGGIVAKARDTNTPNMDYRLELLPAGNVQLTRWNQAAGATENVASTGTVNDGAWHLVVFVNENASSHKLYVDGALDTTSTSTWLYDDSNTEPVRIGRDRNGSSSDQYLNGSIDDVAVLQTALTANDVLDLAHRPHS